MTTTALITERAAQQVSSLRKKERRSYDQFLVALRAQGCAALKYRLSGNDLLSKICVTHLAGAAQGGGRLLVAPHDDGDPFMDVYSQLYELAGLTEPPAAERTKPPCCGVGGGRPPVPDGDLLADLADRARQLSGANRRRARRTAR